MAGRNICKAAGCDKRIPVGAQLCGEHFAELPLEFRRQLNAAYRRFARRRSRRRMKRALGLRNKVLEAVAA